MDTGSTWCFWLFSLGGWRQDHLLRVRRPVGELSVWGDRSGGKRRPLDSVKGQLEACDTGQIVAPVHPGRVFLQQRPRKGRLLGLTRAVALSHGSDERKKGQEILILVNSDQAPDTTVQVLWVLYTNGTFKPWDHPTLCVQQWIHFINEEAEE